MSCSDTTWALAARLVHNESRTRSRRMTGLDVQIELHPVSAAIHVQAVDTRSWRPGEGGNNLVVAVEQVADAERGRHAVPFAFGREGEVSQGNTLHPPPLGRQARAEILRFQAGTQPVAGQRRGKLELGQHIGRIDGIPAMHVSGVLPGTTAAGTNAVVPARFELQFQATGLAVADRRK